MYSISSWSSRSKITQQNLSQIRSSFDEIKQPQNIKFQENMTKILTYYFGKYQSPGILAKFNDDYQNYKPTQWIHHMERILQSIDPSSDTFQKIQANKQVRVNLCNSYLPSHIDLAFLDRYIRKLQIKSTYQGLNMPLTDAYLIMLVRAIYDSQYHSYDVSEHDYLMIDDVYSSLSRNSLLVLLRRCIQYFIKSNNKKLLVKLMSALKLFLFDEVIGKYQKQKMLNKNNDRLNSSRVDMSIDLSFQIPQNINKSIKYRLKPHHLHALMLILQNHTYTHEYFQDFNKYIAAILHYYKSLSPLKTCLASLIRLWIYSLFHQNHNNVQNKLLCALHKASSKQSFFYVMRYKPCQLDYQQRFTPNNIAIVQGFLRIMNRDNHWVPNALYIFSIACLCHILNSSKMFFQQIDRGRITSSSRQQNYAYECMRRMLNSLNDNIYNILSCIRKTNPESLKQSTIVIDDHFECMQKYFNNLQSVLNIGQSQYGPRSQIKSMPRFQFKKYDLSEIQNMDKKSKQINSSDDYLAEDLGYNKSKMISYNKRYHRGCWQIPIQYNQSVILYYITFTIAKMIDFIIPGQRKSPKLNIRFLANPITFAGFIILLIITYFLLWRK